MILDSPNHVVQTIYIDEEDELEAVCLDENTGKIAVCSARNIYIHHPYGVDYEVVKVGEALVRPEGMLTDAVVSPGQHVAARQQRFNHHTFMGHAG